MSTVAARLATVTLADATTADRTAEAARCILFFDGVCGLCSRAVDFVLARDRRGLFQFAPLQGETARQLLPPAEISDLSSMVLLAEGIALTRHVTSPAPQVKVAAIATLTARRLYSTRVNNRM